MSSAKKIATNTGYLLTSAIVSHVFAFFLVILITQYLGDVGFGKYSYAFAFVNIAIIFSHFGMRNYIFREIAKHPSRTSKLVSNTLTMRLAATGVVYVIALLVAFSVPRASEILSLIVLVMVHELLYNFANLSRTVFNAYEENQYSMGSEILHKGLALLVGGLALYFGFGIHGLLVGLIAVQVLVGMYCFIVLRKKFAPISFGFDFREWKSLLRASLPFWLTVVFQRIYYRIDAVMLGSLKGYAVTGLYGAASTVVSALTFISGIIITATFPAMSKFHHKKSHAFLKKLYKKTLYYLFVIGFPAALGLSMLSERVIRFVFREGFLGAGVFLEVLSWSLLFIFLSTISGYFLNAIDQQKKFTLSTGVTALVNVTLNLALIPRLGGLGAAFATVASQLLLFAILYGYSVRYGYGVGFLFMIAKPLFAGLVMGVFVAWAYAYHIAVIIPLAMFLYFGILFFLKGFGEDEFALVRSFLPKR